MSVGRITGRSLLVVCIAAATIRSHFDPGSVAQPWLELRIKQAQSALASRFGPVASTNHKQIACRRVRYSVALQATRIICSLHRTSLQSRYLSVTAPSLAELTCCAYLAKVPLLA